VNLAVIREKDKGFLSDTQVLLLELFGKFHSEPVQVHTQTPGGGPGLSQFSDRAKDRN